MPEPTVGRARPRVPASPPPETRPISPLLGSDFDFRHKQAQNTLSV
jgi:hypothetical protein